MISFKHQIELEGIFLVTLVIVGSIFYVSYKNNHKQQFNVDLSTPAAPAVAEVTALKTTISSQISPDGTKEVVMRVTENSDKTRTYNFSTADENGANEMHIFTKIMDSPSEMSIPFNTWSPDNQYFFIQENAGGTKSVFVFKATGEQFSDTEKYLNATASFSEANTGNIFDEATGWASETLIIINTKKQDGTKGFSYWFEVPSKAIIQLSTEF